MFSRLISWLLAFFKQQDSGYNLPNLAVDGREGIVLEPGDLAGLASALERVASDDEYRERLSTAARARGQELPTWRQTASLFFDTLRRVVE